MARMARVVIPGIPHHITQRGNRRQKVFFMDSDYQYYKELLSEFCEKAQTGVLAYCLMPNHVHLILVPKDENGLHQAIGEAHRRYTRHINFREGWRGYLWQGRFSSFPMDEDYLWAAVRYVELNPVRAGLCSYPEEWRWSSARAHVEGANDGLVNAAVLLDQQPDWHGFLASGLDSQMYDSIRKHERSGRPLGGDDFVSRIETISGRILRRKKLGRKPLDKVGN
ncbi:MAG: transposase [Thiotrichales bacterium]|nr:MAG: transposase [Thiotrichales bacterium]